MLKLIILYIFMIPLILNHWVSSNMVTLTTLIFMLFFFNFFMIGYMTEIAKISFGLIMLWI